MGIRDTTVQELYEHTIRTDGHYFSYMKVVSPHYMWGGRRLFAVGEQLRRKMWVIVFVNGEHISIDENVTIKKDEHHIINKNIDLATCGICGQHFGWYCVESPTKYCEYNWETHGENCVHCGEPEERK